MSEKPTAKDLTHNARNALRRIRRATVDGEISAEEMHNYSTEVLNRFAKALLEHSYPEKLKPEDQGPEISHIESLNRYIDELTEKTGEETLLLAGQQIEQDRINLMVTVLTRMNYLSGLGVDINNDTIIAPLATGAIMLAITSYLNDIPIHFAAVDRDRRNATVSPRIDLEKPIIIIDDVVGAQAAAVETHLRKKGHTVKKKSHFS